ncbi:uncharacterized protein LOC133194465 isoform X2 [Saccostrea echinata]|uniref:uncharacterized protein LOC133194465 isoform X2 n=1 Tax=Saccostrea echinata TaxID=191078 RepID=UPI002A80E414|nr:uncharacterized protein LOC133194465 isoform X2 [Saccostrea echinata]
MGNGSSNVDFMAQWNNNIEAINGVKEQMKNLIKENTGVKEQMKDLIKENTVVQTGIKSLTEENKGITEALQQLKISNDKILTRLIAIPAVILIIYGIKEFLSKRRRNT